MPSIDAVEQFKSIVQGLADEPAIRERLGLPEEEILPPESPMDGDLADLLGNLPTDEPEELAQELGDDLDIAAPDLDDLFSAPLPSLDDEPAGPSFDDLLGPPAEDPVPAEEDPPFGGLDLGGLDDFSVPDDLTAGLSEDLGADLDADFGSDLPDAPPSLDDDFEFADGVGAADFPELAGFADTKEEDVEAFDALGEADEFQLGDFESQFGITADDHTDAELLNPAETVDLEVDAAQKTLSLSEEEFSTIQRALGQLPLNLRLAVEELIGEKEVVFEDLDKIVSLLLNRAPVRTLANAVGKILGRKIVVPPGFEKGSGADLEARYNTLWYNLRTIMLPILRVSALVTVAVAVLVLLGWNFLLRPFKANDLYEKGLVAALHDDGARADDLFAQAWYYWPVTDRFFQYAEAYEDTGDYDRARRKYLELLKPSVKPYRDEDKARLEERFGKPLAPLPEGLEGKALADRLATKRASLDSYYAYVAKLLGSKEGGAGIEGDIPGEVFLGNPDTRGILDYSRFETNFGFDGRDKEAHFRRADAILTPLLADHPGDKAGLLRKGDNQLAWSRSLSSRENLDQANSAFSEYLRLYGYDAAVTWRFVRVFLLEDEEEELLKFRERINNDHRMAMDGETMALLAKWLIDKEETTVASERAVVPTQKSIEDEYRIRPKPVELPEAPAAGGEGGAHAAPAEAGAPAHRLTRSEAAAAEGGGGGEGEKKGVELTPPYKYPNSSQPFRAAYLDKVDTLLLRAMDTEKSLPELHYQLSRFYRHNKNQEDERRALAAADTYFQRLAPRMSRLNERPAMRVATSNRIGEVFEAQGQPVQAEKYYLDAQRSFEAFRAQGLVSLDADTARLYRNLGNLYYRQTPGVESVGRGTVPGGWEQALKLYETALKGHWEEPVVSYRIGVIEYEKRNFGAAVKEFFALDRVGNLGEASGRSNPNLLYAMGNALFRSGNFASAEGYYRELLDLLRERRARITDFDPVGRATHKALAQRLYETWNNLAAAEYRAANTFRAGTPEFKEAIAALTTARAQAQILGRELYEGKGEFDVTQNDSEAIADIRADEARILSQTRKEKGLVEANLQVLSMIETATPARKEALADRLEIFARIPLDLDQMEAP